jgi:hypothetical protein
MAVVLAVTRVDIVVIVSGLAQELVCGDEGRWDGRSSSVEPGPSRETRISHS